MIKAKLNIWILALSVSCIVPLSVSAATIAARTGGAKTVSVVGNATGVRAKVEASNIYSQDCYNSYFGCMDQFCAGDSTVLNIPDGPVTLDGGTCACSDEGVGYKKQISEMNSKLANAQTLSTVEVEKIQAGAKADIVFGGERSYDSSGNVISLEDTEAKNKKANLLSMWNTSSPDESEDIFTENEQNLSTKTGDALQVGARDLCISRMPDSCNSDANLLTQLYTTQVRNDCRAFGNTIAKMQESVNTVFANAQKSIRDARLTSFESSNKFDRGQCMLEFRKCMNGTDVCGSDWSKCVGEVAYENMQSKTVSTAGSNIQTVAKFEIADSTMESLDSKRNICEKVLDQCVAVRDNVWSDFIREVAPDLKIAELNNESKRRQSCLTDISACIQTACKDDIEGKGVATMDSCLSRPEMARSFCKVQIDACERMEPLIWGYVTDKLKSMRVDRCTQEVKDCFTSDDRCGSNFEKCVGMDYKYIHDICPIDKLVVCKQNNPQFAMDDLDSMLMGLYLNIDNSALENCQNLVSTKMEEVCGSTTDCNKFASDDTIGTSSIKSQKDGTIYRVTGMISFGSIKMGDASGKTKDVAEDGTTTILAPGQLGVEEYIAKVRRENTSVANAAGIITSVEEELNNIAGTINRVTQMIEQDPKIQYCISGRSLEQVTGKSEKTSARFPNLLNSVKMQIAIAALRQANENYNKKVNKAISDATKGASADLAQYMCQKMAESSGATTTTSGDAPDPLSTPLTPPYAISYDVGAGLTTDQLMTGGHGQSQMGGLKQEGYKFKVTAGGVTTETWAIFNRDARNCHLCKSTVKQDCKTSGSRGLFGLWDSRKTNCTSSDPVEKCEDIAM